MKSTNRKRLKWLAVFLFGFSLFLMLAVAAVLFHSPYFADRLAQILGHPVSEYQRLAVSLAVGFVVELVFMGSAYLLFPKGSDR